MPRSPKRASSARERAVSSPTVTNGSVDSRGWAPHSWRSRARSGPTGEPAASRLQRAPTIARGSTATGAGSRAEVVMITRSEVAVPSIRSRKTRVCIRLPAGTSSQGWSAEPGGSRLPGSSQRTAAASAGMRASARSTDRSRRADGTAMMEAPARSVATRFRTVTVRPATERAASRTDAASGRYRRAAPDRTARAGRAQAGRSVPRNGPFIAATGSRSDGPASSRRRGATRGLAGRPARDRPRLKLHDLSQRAPTSPGANRSWSTSTRWHEGGSACRDGLRPVTTTRVGRRYSRECLRARRGASVCGGCDLRGEPARIVQHHRRSEGRKRCPTAQRERIDGGQARRDEEHPAVVVVVVEEAAHPYRVGRSGVGERRERGQNNPQRDEPGERGAPARHARGPDTRIARPCQAHSGSGLSDGAAGLQVPRDEPAGQGPDQAGAPAGQYVARVVDPEVDATAADRERRDQGHGEQVHLGVPSYREAGQQGSEGEVQDGGQERVPAREARRGHRDEVGDQVGARPAEEILHAGGEQAPTRGGDSHQPHRAIFSLERKVSDDEERDGDEHGTAAEGRDVPGRFEEPRGPYRRVGGARNPEQAEDPLVEVSQLSLAELRREPDEAEERQEDDQRGHEHGRLLPGEPSGPGQDGAAGRVGRLAQAAADVIGHRARSRSSVAPSISPVPPRSRARTG